MACGCGSSWGMRYEVLAHHMEVRLRKRPGPPELAAGDEEGDEVTITGPNLDGQTVTPSSWDGIYTLEPAPQQSLDAPRQTPDRTFGHDQPDKEGAD